MRPVPIPAEEVRLSCRACVREIPASEANCPEAVDYVLHYCGIECYGVWEAQAQRSESGAVATHGRDLG